MDFERIRAFAVYDLGLTAEEFWNSTGRQFSYLTDRWKEQRKQEDRRAGEIVAILFNVNRDTKEVPEGIHWTDVFTEWKEPVPEQTEDEMFQTMMAFARIREGLPA